jgi:diadenosine tetraphosphate (Ap4A) HIT family hydrolase
VIPKEHAVKFHELSDESLADILPVAKKVAIALGVSDFNVLNNNGIQL